MEPPNPGLVSVLLSHFEEFELSGYIRTTRFL